MKTIRHHGLLWLTLCTVSLLVYVLRSEAVHTFGFELVRLAGKVL